LRAPLIITALFTLTLHACSAQDAAPNAAPQAPPSPAASASPSLSSDAQDHLLTPLPVRVDTSSYTQARLHLLHGDLPEPDSIKVSDFLHFFLPQPQDPALIERGPLLLSLEASPSPYDAQRVLLRVDLEAAPPAPRAPVHLVFLVDTSGSMQSAHKVGLVKHALKALVDGLGPQDTLALVYEGQGAQVALPPTPASRRGALLAAIEGLSSPPPTLPAKDGLALAYELAGAMSAQGSRRVVWCSDGDFWRSDRDPAALAARWAPRGVGLQVWGYGEDLRDPFLASLPPDATAHIQTKRGALQALDAPSLGGVGPRALDVEWEVALHPTQVHAWRLIGHEAPPAPDTIPRDEDLGDRDLSAGRVVTAYLELTLTAPLEATDAPLAVARARYRDPAQPLTQELEAALPATQAQGDFAARSARFRLGAALVGFGERLRRSPWSDASLPQAREIAQDALGADPGEDQIELLDLMDRADLLLAP
jgi:Ca-activated chloride channel family protein